MTLDFRANTERLYIGEGTHQTSGRPNNFVRAITGLVRAEAFGYFYEYLKQIVGEGFTPDVMELMIVAKSRAYKEKLGKCVSYAKANTGDEISKLKAAAPPGVLE